MIHSCAVQAKFCLSHVTEQVSSPSLVAFLAGRPALSHGSVLVSLYTLCCRLVPLTATWKQHSCSKCRIHSPRVCTNPFDHFAYTRCAYQCISNSKVSAGKVECRVWIVNNCAKICVYPFRSLSISKHTFAKFVLCVLHSFCMTA